MNKESISDDELCDIVAEFLYTVVGEDYIEDKIDKLRCFRKDAVVYFAIRGTPELYKFETCTGDFLGTITNGY